MSPHSPHITRLVTEVPDAPEAELTVAPRNPQDVASVLRYASEKSLNVQVLGGGSRSGFGSPPPPEIVISMERLGDVEKWEPDDLTLVVGAGASVAGVEAMLAERSQTTVLPEVPGPSTVGGVIASGSSSLRRGRLYGTRERVLETTIVTGDGRIVRSGGRVVKNVTGYDLPRLAVGAFGSLGVIVSVCLKLWPVPPDQATVSVAGPEEAAEVARPLAVLQDNDSTRVFVWGTVAEVAAKVARLGGDAAEGHDWPADPQGAFRWSLRVPPAMTAEAVGRLPAGWRYLAIHRVGEIRAASDDLRGAAELRSWAESNNGHLVVVSAPADALDGLDPWGRLPPALEIQKRRVLRGELSHPIPSRGPSGGSQLLCRSYVLAMRPGRVRAA